MASTDLEVVTTVSLYPSSSQEMVVLELLRADLVASELPISQSSPLLAVSKEVSVGDSFGDSNS